MGIVRIDVGIEDISLVRRVTLLVKFISRPIQAHWLLIHALIAPWGSMIATGVLVNIDKSSGETWIFWLHWNDLAAMSGMAGFGAMVYGSAVSSLEVIVRMPFYAIAKILEEQEKKRKERERMQNEAREAGLTEGREEGREAGRKEGIDLVINNPALERYPELREKIRRDVESAMGASKR